jgi:hypothetical protein
VNKYASKSQTVEPELFRVVTPNQFSPNLSGLYSPADFTIHFPTIFPNDTLSYSHSHKCPPSQRIRHQNSLYISCLICPSYTLPSPCCNILMPTFFTSPPLTFIEQLVLKYSYFVCFPQIKGPAFTPAFNDRKKIVLRILSFIKICKAKEMKRLKRFSSHISSWIPYLFFYYTKTSKLRYNYLITLRFCSKVWLVNMFINLVVFMFTSTIILLLVWATMSSILFIGKCLWNLFSWYTWVYPKVSGLAALSENCK